MTEWIRETPARWDAGKARALGDLAPGLFGLGEPAAGDPLADEWWRIEDGETVLGYARLDDTWGDAEVLVLVDPSARRRGVGRFAMDRLEAEARGRGLNYVYNVVPLGHPDPEPVRAWLHATGFADSDDGELRKRVAAG